MAFDYDKAKRKASDTSDHWTSNSDLFMVLSVVFLLLYVVASVRNGTSNITQAVQLQQIASQKEDLQRQLRAYNALKNEALEKDSSEEEVKMYQELMSKLDLLQDETDKERKELENQARANADKVEALNQYQQMVRNIINTNLLAKKRIERRDKVIVEKKEIITEQVQTIKGLDETIQEQAQDIEKKANVISQKEQLISKQNEEIEEKEREISDRKVAIRSLENEVDLKKEILAKNAKRIDDLNSKLDGKIVELQEQYKKQNKTETEMRQAVLKLRLASRNEVKKLKEEKDQVASRLTNLNEKLEAANVELSSASRKIEEQENRKQQLENELKQAELSYQKQMKDLESDFNSKVASERKALEAKLNQEKASAKEKAQKLAEFKDQAAKEREVLQSALGELQGKVSKVKGDLKEMSEKAKEYADKLADAKKDHANYLASISKLKSDKENLSGDLERIKKIANAKKDLANKIADNLKKQGVKANVDPKSGDVTLSFGDEYFDSGRADLKESMQKTLQKFIPEYARSLLENDEIAKQVQSVEIVGFSSPTYKGKYIDPQSLKPEDRAALDYNLDLSFKRAKAIFTYMTDTQKMNYRYQKKIQPLIKVTGRSYLADGVQGRSIASGISQKEYCSKYDCDKSQKVIVRFNLKD